MADVVADLVAKLGVMKPSSVKTDNLKHTMKLAELFASPEYILEDKIDGCHYMQVANRYFSTEHIEKTDNYPHLRDFFRKLQMPNLILDGEVNYPGKTSQFCTRITGADPLTAINAQKTYGPIHYTIWDMLRTPKGTWLVNEPLRKRRQILEYFYQRYIAETPAAEFIHLTQWIIDDKKKTADSWIANGAEGAVLKHLNSLYIMNKKPQWQWTKYKVKDTADLFISGYEPAKIDYSGTEFDTWAYWKEINGVSRPVTKFHYYDWIGALELSAMVNGEVTKICTCAGIDETLRKDISENPQAYLNRVVKIEYMEKTEAGYPRHPRFIEFHESKTAAECTWDFSE